MTQLKTAKKPGAVSAAKKTLSNKGKPTLSIVVPLYNEQDNINPLVTAVEKAMEGMAFELVLVDDGSVDATVECVLALKQPWVKLVVFARNFGQTSAMAAGIDAAAGEFIATMDGDLQNDPTDIPRMLDRLKKENLDVVAGIREKRKDGMVLRKIPSMIANKLIRRLSHVQVQDYGCTLKVFRSSIAKNLDLYGELHRFIPILADMNGAKIVEMNVKHHARQFGQSKYGLSRTLRVASDLLLMAFFIRYRQKPMHLFGSLGLMLGMIGGSISLYLAALKVVGEDIGDRPIFFVAILLIITAVQLITTGFVAELQMRTLFQSGGKRPYVISKCYLAGKVIPAKNIIG